MDQPSNIPETIQDGLVSSPEELTRMLLKRRVIKRIMHYPILEELAKGCIVRVVLPTVAHGGFGKKTKGPRKLAIGEILEVVKGEDYYEMYRATLKTRKFAKVQIFGETTSRQFRFTELTNENISKSEFEGLRKLCELNNGLSLPSLQRMKAKFEQIRNAEVYIPTVRDKHIASMEIADISLIPTNIAKQIVQLDYQGGGFREANPKPTSRNRHSIRTFTKEIMKLDRISVQRELVRKPYVKNLETIHEKIKKNEFEAYVAAVKDEKEEDKAMKSLNPESFRVKSFARKPTTKSQYPVMHLEETFSDSTQNEIILPTTTNDGRVDLFKVHSDAIFPKGFSFSGFSIPELLASKSNLESSKKTSTNTSS